MEIFLLVYNWAIQPIYRIQLRNEGLENIADLANLTSIYNIYK